MKKTFLTLGLCWSVVAWCSSQSISSSVIGNAGTYLEAAGFGSLHFTVGEVAVARYDNQIELGEGFHRAETELIVFSEEILTSRQDYQVYPNPTRDYLVIATEQTGWYEVSMLTSSGRVVLPSRVGHDRTEVDVSTLPGGAYWLRLRDEHGQTSVFPVIKVDR